MHSHQQAFFTETVLGVLMCVHAFMSLSMTQCVNNSLLSVFMQLHTDSLIFCLPRHFLLQVCDSSQHGYHPHSARLDHPHSLHRWRWKWPPKLANVHVGDSTQHDDPNACAASWPSYSCSDTCGHRTKADKFRWVPTRVQQNVFRARGNRLGGVRITPSNDVAELAAAKKKDS